MHTFLYQRFIQAGCTSWRNIAKIATKRLMVFIFLVAVFLWPSLASAQGIDFGTSYGSAIGLGTQDIRVTVANIIRYALGVLGIIVILIIIYGGYVWMTAGGNEQKVAMAKKIILNGVIGLLIVVLAYALTVWIFRVIIGGTTGGGGGSCTEGEINGCSECVGGEWIYNSSIPGCTLPGADFRVRDVSTSHQGSDPKQEVNLCSRVQPRFSNSVDPDSVIAAAAAGQLSVEVMPGTWQTAGNTVTFKHDDQLFAPFTDYQLRLPKQGNSTPLKDLGGLTLTACDPIAGCGSSSNYFTWDFTTGNDVDEISPYITDTYPVSDLADPTYPNRNVSRSPIFTVNFSESIDATTVIDEAGHPLAANIILQRLDGSGGTVLEVIDNTIMDATMTSNGFSFSLVDPNLLDEFTWYRLTVQNVEDLCGNSMVEPLVWEFQTNDNVPGVVNWSPKGNNSCPDTTILVTFGTSMFDKTLTFVMTGSDGSVYDAAINPSLLEPGPYQVAGTNGSLAVLDPGLPYSDHFRTFEFVPYNPLNSNTSFEVNIDTDLVMNTNGDTLSHSWSFTVSDAANCVCSPYITALSPSEGMAGQCITVQGRCFAGTAANPAQPSEVTIDGQATAIGGWGSNYLTTTVPQDLAPGTVAPAIVTITYDNAALGSLISNDNQSYYVNQSGIYDGPCLWSVSPDTACYGANVTFTGERLGSDPGVYDSDQNNITFTSNIRAQNSDFTLWSDSQIKTKVPPAAVDGDVYATVDYVLSNALPYNIDCGAGSACSSDPNICDPNPTVCATGYECNVTSCICEASGGGGGGGGFQVIDHWPSCNGACINSELGAKFSADVDVATLAGSLSLWQCSDAACTSGSDTAFTYSYNNTDFELYIYPSSNLNNDSYYRMILADTILNLDGSGIANINFDADGDGSNDSFSWKFSTNAEVCELTAVETTPDLLTFSSLGQNKNIYGKAISSQQCVGSSYVNPWAYDWKWDDADSGNIVTVASNDNNSDGNIDPEQPVTAQAAGDSQVIGKVGVLQDSSDVSVVPGLGEDCDADSNTPQCEPNDTYCATFGLVCDPDQACTCQEASGGVGTPCDADPNTPQCEPDATACDAGLVCDPLASCTCQEPPLPPPAVVLVMPAGGSTNICRNTFIEATFNQPMDSSSINENSFFITTVGPNDIMVGTIINYFVGNGEYGCNNVSGCTLSRFYPNQPFSATTDIQVTIGASVKNVEGTEMGFPVTWSFTTGDEICKLSSVEMEPIYHLFTTAGEIYNYTATAKSSNGQLLAPIPGVYNWLWTWTKDDPDNIITMVQLVPDASEVTANPVNGRADITATAEITEVSLGIDDTVGRQVNGYAEAETFICLYPWPDPVPFEESAYGFQTKYCRGNDPDSLLGMLSDPASSVVNTGSEPDLLKEYLFSYLPGTIDSGGKAEFELGKLWQKIKSWFGGKAQAQIPDDVIGLRIYDNPDRLGPLAWYNQRSFPKGNPQTIEVDGFPAIKDGNSVYILGARQGGAIGTYIFVLSYNDLSSLDNIGIFNQIIDNFRFYTFDFMTKPKVVRDLKRLADVSLVSTLVEQYKNQTGNYPTLPAGSYIAGMSTSKWPSWQATLGNQLGTSLPTDPINKFTSYCSDDSAIQCWQDSDCASGAVCLSGCPEGSDPDTCWNEVTQQFHCPLGSSVYQYRLNGADDYRLGVFLEMDNWEALPGYLDVGAQYCDGTVYTSQGFCGDGIIQPSLGEECELGEQMLFCPNDWANFYDPQYLECVLCQWPEGSEPTECGGYCGDGIVQDPPEVCDGSAGLEGKGPAICQNDCLNFYCQPGYALIDGVCELTWCDPDLQDCSDLIANGSGQYQTCSFDGSSWNWSDCVVTSCDEGYHIFNNSCVADGGGGGEGTPTVSILSPTDPASGGGDVTIQYVYGQPAGIEFLVDGSVVGGSGGNGGTYLYQFTNLTIGPHILEVTVSNANGSGSDQINYTVLDNPPPSAPTGLTAVYTSPNVILNWTDNSNNETNFIIQRSVNNTVDWADYATLGANIITYTDSNVSSPNTYYYRVRAYNANGDSAYSNVASAALMKASIFVSSATFTGDIKNAYYPACNSFPNAIDKANCICDDLASNSSYAEPGVWRAWLSIDSPGGSANDNFSGHDDVPYKLPGGTLVATNYADLTDGTIQNPINKNENNAFVLNSEVWTDTKPDGTYYSWASQSCSCDGWGSVASWYNGAYGLTNSSDSTWTNALPGACVLYGAGCGEQKPLYCMYYTETPPI